MRVQNPQLERTPTTLVSAKPGFHREGGWLSAVLVGFVSACRMCVLPLLLIGPASCCQAVEV
jgi:hypothetical protein